MNAAVNALDCTLTDRATRGARQVEEHYLRESSMPRAHRVRERLNEAIGMSDAAITGLAREILNLGTGHTERQPLRREGIDEGVGLR